MASFPFDIVGFDLDGTLVDTSRDLAASVNHTLASAGRARLPVPRIVAMIGGGARHMLAQALDATGGCDERELDRLHDVLLDHYAAHICVESAPYPGIVAALDDLAARGVTLAVATNKLERFTHALLDQLGLMSRFAAIIGGDTLGPGMTKPSPAPIEAMIARAGGGRAAFVGDSVYDVAAAHTAGVPAILYRGGFTRDGIDKLGADAIIDDYGQLVATLERL
ncbi:HAD-IA family hydrolase [uncultured Sphingomonas sp.]|uniref:HAD-IA family hydrolase n=1 Tax=uncultured Sphingomonas sp. TaxID=158754 RepID=UPI00262BE5C7|nr:HAD-IA family hydrolase [uncultured Sphingomonas sp.]